MSDSASLTAEILPVLDLMGGVVVRGVAGRRDTYQPISSELVDSAEPDRVARAFQEKLGLHRFYVADLDAIEHDRPSLSMIERLADNQRQVLVDAGLRDIERARALLDHGATAVIAGLETLPGPQLLQRLVDAIGPDRLIFSLDLKQGVPMVDPTVWPDPRPLELADSAIAAGVKQLIVLDLAGVGTGSGLPTLPLCRQIREKHPDVALITGGGIRNRDDIVSAARAGVDSVLVASALHDGSLVP